MDLTPYLDLAPAPQALFDSVQRYGGEQARFHVPENGTWRVVTRQQFQDRVAQLAHFLAANDLGPGTQSALLGHNSVDWAAAALAIQAVGAAMVPIYPSFTPDLCGYLLGHCDAQVLFVDESLLKVVTQAWGQFPLLRKIVVLQGQHELNDVIAEASAQGQCSAQEIAAMICNVDQAATQGQIPDSDDRYAQLLQRLDLDSPGSIIYTSGTTGRPKGVVLSHRNVGINGLDWLRNHQTILQEGWTDVLWLPLSHVFGWGELCLGTLLGFSTYLSTPPKLLGHLREVQPQVFMSVPAFWEKFYLLASAEATTPEAQQQALLQLTGGRLQFCLSGGAGLKRQVKDFYLDAGLLIIEGYGLTEASPTLTLNHPQDFNLSSVGKPLHSVQLKLADDGEILAKGPNVFSQYYKNPKASRAAFDDEGWLLTGDIGQFDAQGFLSIIDRKKDILVTAGGKNVPPANIELLFSDDPLVEHLVVYGDGQKYLTALLVPAFEALEKHAKTQGWDFADTHHLISLPEVKTLYDQRVAAVNQSLASYEQIKKITLANTPLSVEAGLLTTSLKVRRKQVYSAFGQQLEALYAEA